MKKQQQGFTLIELMIVIAIIGILAAVAFPSYQDYLKNGRRVEMMTELQNIANTIESKKLALGSYNNVTLPSNLTGSFPRNGTPIYTISISTPITSQWELRAVPISGGQMKNDGTLTLSGNGTKCRVITSTNKKCGNDWKD